MPHIDRKSNDLLHVHVYVIPVKNVKKLK